MRITINTVMFLQLMVAIFVAIITIISAYWLPIKFADRLGDMADESQWVIFFLGGSLVVYFMLDSFRGVITGSHRWDIHNAIIAATHVFSFIFMAGSIFLGGGLLELSIIYFCVSSLGELARAYYGFKLYPDLKLGLLYVNKKKAKEIIVFGLKTVSTGLAPLFVIQSTSILIMGALGPAALAVFVRPISLIRHVRTIVNKYAFVLTPMAGSIQAQNNERELSLFLIDTTRYSVSFTLPIVLFLAVFGDRILYYWMGDGYSHGELIAILAVGYFLPISQSPAMRILVGLNAHGRAAVWSLAVAMLVYLCGVYYVEVVGWTLINAALLVSVSLTASQGIAVPICACRRLHVSLPIYLYKVFTVPVMCCGLYLLFMLWVREEYVSQPDFALLLGGVLGGFGLLPLYWLFLVPDSFKKIITQKVMGKFN